MWAFFQIAPRLPIRWIAVTTIIVGASVAGFLIKTVVKIIAGVILCCPAPCMEIIRHTPIGAGFNWSKVLNLTSIPSVNHVVNLSIYARGRADFISIISWNRVSFIIRKIVITIGLAIGKSSAGREYCFFLAANLKLGSTIRSSFTTNSKLGKALGYIGVWAGATVCAYARAGSSIGVMLGIHHLGSHIICFKNSGIIFFLAIGIAF